MSITDELREWIGTIAWLDDGVSHSHKNILAIADRIDAEHERAMAAAALIAGVPMTDENMAEHGWVRLPVDADGVPIRVGDMVDVREIIERVIQIRYTLATSSKAPTVLTSIITDASQLPQKPSSYRHHHAPTVEDVLRECCHKYHSLLIDDMNDAINGVERDYIAPDEIIAEFAAKLQLREVDE